MAKTKPKDETPNPEQKTLFGKAGELYNYLELRVTSLIEEVEAQQKKIQTAETYIKVLGSELEKVREMKKGLEGSEPEKKQE